MPRHRNVTDTELASYRANGKRISYQPPRFAAATRQLRGADLHRAERQHAERVKLALFAGFTPEQILAGLTVPAIAE